jgi:hypothetical protein
VHTPDIIDKLPKQVEVVVEDIRVKHNVCLDFDRRRVLPVLRVVRGRCSVRAAAAHRYSINLIGVWAEVIYGHIDILHHHCPLGNWLVPCTCVRRRTGKAALSLTEVYRRLSVCHAGLLLVNNVHARDALTLWNSVVENSKEWK